MTISWKVGCGFEKNGDDDDNVIEHVRFSLTIEGVTSRARKELLSFMRDRDMTRHGRRLVVGERHICGCRDNGELPICIGG